MPIARFGDAEFAACLATLIRRWGQACQRTDLLGGLKRAVQEGT
jgi:hypothetical protein